MNKDEKRLLQRKRLMDNKVYQTMNDITRYMDRYYLDAVIGVIPGWGDIITIFCAVPFIYFSTRVIKSIPLTLAIINQHKEHGNDSRICRRQRNSNQRSKS